MDPILALDTRTNTDTPRPPSPSFPLENSLHQATATINQLTSFLVDSSRPPSPEPATALSCCCGKHDCENLKSWLEVRSKLNNRVIMCATLGNALLEVQKHADPMPPRESKNREDTTPALSFRDLEESFVTNKAMEALHEECDKLTRRNRALAKKLAETIAENESTQASNSALMQELQEAQRQITRLSKTWTQTAKWNAQLSEAWRERDDMQQERDAEMNRARLAESRFVALKNITTKLHADVRRLQANLDEKRQSRMEDSGNVLQDARSRMNTLRTTQSGLTVEALFDEMTGVLDTLANTNDTLQKDNAELQHFLTESRDELHTLREELDEYRAASVPVPRPPSRTTQPRHYHTSSVPSASLNEYNMPMTPQSKASRLAPTTEPRWRNSWNRPTTAPTEPRTPLSPAGSLAPPDTSDRWSPFNGRLSPKYPISRINSETDEDTEDTPFSEPSQRKTQRPLLLLSKSLGPETLDQAVQTDPPTPPTSSPFRPPLHSLSPFDPRSEASSVSDSPLSQLGTILERISAAYHRLSQADALTLSNRFKAQNIRGTGADVSHLSRSTVKDVLNELVSIRTTCRNLLEDDKVVIPCNRKDLRLLFKLMKDVFGDMGELRVTLNDIILDPSSAVRISEATLNPGKADAGPKEDRLANLVSAAGWMGPISKLFSPTGGMENGSSDPTSGLSRSQSQRNTTSRGGRFVPKLGPALGASATTVNVEFSGNGVGRAVTSAARSIPVSDSVPSIPASQSGAPSLMGIFAGAPTNGPVLDPEDPWVVLQSTPAPPEVRKSRSFMKASTSEASAMVPSTSTATVGRSLGRKQHNRLSRNVDAVIDFEHPREEDEDAEDDVSPLTGRTLRRRGLSDSSIHSTFTSHADTSQPDALSGQAMPPSPTRPVPIKPSVGKPSSRMSAWPDTTSVLHALSRTMQTFKSTAESFASTGTAASAQEVRRGVPSRSSTITVNAATTAVTSRPGPSTTNPSMSRLGGSIGPRPPPLDLSRATPQPPQNVKATSSSSSSQINQPTSPPPQINTISAPLTPTQSESSSTVTTRPGVVAARAVRGPQKRVRPSWAGNDDHDDIVDPMGPADAFVASSLRDESLLSRMARNRATREGDFF